MHFMPPALVLISGWVIAIAAAEAAGFGPTPVSVPLGSPLSLAVPLQLDGNDLLEPECVAAEVTVGDRRVAAHNLRWTVEPGPRPGDRLIRVSTVTPVDEPVVSVWLAAGCTTRITRRFTVFADPPLFAAAIPAGLADAGAVTATRPAPPPPAARPVVAAAPAPSAEAVAPTRRSASPSARAGAKTPDRSPSSRQRDAGARKVAKKASPRPRLRLDAAEPERPASEVALAGVAASAVASALQAAAAASAAEAAASAANARVQALEQQVQQLLAQGRAQQVESQQLRRQLAAQSDGSWAPWLGAALAVLMALVVWLGWRLRAAQREVQARWWSAAQAEVQADLTPDEPEAADVPPPDHRLAAVVADARSAVPAGPSPAVAAPVAAEPGWSTSTPPRPVSVEELIDLEQQAEFFIVLGQDDAAVDLLVSHIRSSGGISPLPYLKLLEIYRRRGEHENYERTRARFNQRFNAYAPEWDADLQHGRLLDAYPEVIETLQKAWPSPLDAMTVLESLLFRTDSGQLFDLPAYREVLLLYSLARDLHDSQGSGTAAVDLLLPLDLPSVHAGFPPRGDRTDDTPLLAPEVRVPRSTEPGTLDLDLGSAHDAGEITHPAAFTELELGVDSRLGDLPVIDDRPATRRRRS